MLGVFVEADAVGARDTVVNARLCLAIPATESVASMSGRLTVDTSFAKVIAVSRPPGSAFIANADSAGNVMVAGAAGGGLHAGTVLTLRARLARAGVIPRIDFLITELNAGDGQSVVTRATARALEPTCAGNALAVFEVLPPGASADPAEPLDLRINGCGFDASHNTIRVGEIIVRDVRATEHGTRIRVVVPKEYRTSSEVPPMVMGAGTYDVTVDNGREKSNARRITLH